MKNENEEMYYEKDIPTGAVDRNEFIFGTDINDEEYKHYRAMFTILNKNVALGNIPKTWGRMLSEYETSIRMFFQAGLTSMARSAMAHLVFMIRSSTSYNAVGLLTSTGAYSKQEIDDYRRGLREENKRGVFDKIKQSFGNKKHERADEERRLV